MAFKITYQVPPFAWQDKTTVEETTREEALKTFKLQYPQAKIVEVERVGINGIH